ncbi:MAG TPA: ABC transporter ATP-binding protein [Gemmatimonadaceae bacterium]|jgi:ABC-2 type transport system ATP-binding protein
MTAAVKNEPAILIEHVVKQYGNFTAVNDVSLTVDPGETLGLLGPNGAGKSTLIRMLTTLVPITSGRIVLHGDDVSQEPDHARLSIGVIPQAMTSDTDLSIEENLSIYAKLYGVPRDVRRKVIPELLELVNLADRRKSLVGTLSGGMRRRVEIARGLVHSPLILVLDEPTTGLDPVSRVDVWEMLTRIKRERQLTILVTTHYMDEADRLCDRIAIVDRGKLVALDTPRALKSSVPGASAIEAQFLSAPADWEDKLHALGGVTTVQPLGGDAWRIVTGDAGQTTMSLAELALARGVTIRSLSVNSTTLDDVFVYYTGRALHDVNAATGQASGPPGRGRPGGAAAA